MYITIVIAMVLLIIDNIKWVQFLDSIFRYPCLTAHIDVYY